MIVTGSPGTAGATTPARVTWPWKRTSLALAARLTASAARAGPAVTRASSATTTRNRFTSRILGFRRSRLVLVRVVDVVPGHGDAERPQAVLDPHRGGVGGEDVGQALVHLRRLVRSAAHEHDALLAQPLLDGRPVDTARLDLLLDPDLRHAGLGVVRAGRVRLEHARAVAVAARPARAAAHPPRRLRTAHHAPRAVNGGVECLRRLLARDTLEDHRLVAHRPAHEPLLTRSRRGAALADDAVVATEVRLPPGEVVVVVDLVGRLGTEDAEHLLDDDVATRIGVLARQLHRRDVRLPELRVELEQDRRRGHGRARESRTPSCARSHASRSARRSRPCPPRLRTG